MIIAECGRTFQDNSGSFTSPHYYTSVGTVEPEKCEWRITATHGERIILNITDLVRQTYFINDKHTRYDLMCVFRTFSNQIIVERITWRFVMVIGTNHPFWEDIVVAAR